ncbi:MAG: DUF4863 family protein [Myxococcales bacterium]|nr:DUF4863 family protein [Myxococcales bacterium]
MDRDAFRAFISGLTAQIDGRPLDGALAEHLNTEHGPGSVLYEDLAAAIRAAVAAGWMCDREAGGIRYGRVVKPAPETHGFSVDVVDMNDCAGPHHVHPDGEIDLVVPVEGAPLFDGQGAGWKVYGPGSAHSPTVRGGRAFVLYLLPRGAIQFTGQERERAR